ncbi:3-oxoacyl-[acyl-carrier protein] reductase [Pedobacter steynii]|uniref:3-oxoacyl-[acyl-carrier protein] reductase n=1 Tax=Pedobacter steynii TaxID=430522 RepID=A0A1G9WHB4_9SPHI|nr:SDR family oxidoreductase [Pedobacter steynii]NQX40290.1 SDR family oxidoreductase [Pedobacter steynii]SDM83581.1 3-oxoacyl-[acyl-carrier protein] reductase [Pedobacter steynii]
MNNIIFITGASSDIGIQLIRSLTEECLIIAHYNTSLAPLTEVSKEISNVLIPIQADLASESEVCNLLDYVEENYGVPNKIVHLAAAKFENVRFKDIEWPKFQDEILLSLKSVILILNRFLPKLAKEKRGKVILMLSSVTINVPPKALVQYTTVKYALLGLMKSLASEYADKGININAISPSMIETKFLSLINEKFVEISAASNPMKRNATVNDVIPVMLLLLSDESQYINGINIPITGGSIF